MKIEIVALTKVERVYHDTINYDAASNSPTARKTLKEHYTERLIENTFKFGKMFSTAISMISIHYSDE